ncbi:MAG TPA: hypothetical protein VG122_12440, partial [Gemmata sp.]|nr:hypothetical protein [Gemmata sp.]
MLKPEVARQQLEQLKSKKHAQGRIVRLRKLAKPFASAGLGITGRLPDGNYPKEWIDRSKLKNEAVAKLNRDAKVRSAVFAALFPTFHAEFEAGWQQLSAVPYTIGYTRRPFRVPNRPEAYLGKRLHYIDEVLDAVEEFPDDTLTPEWLAAWCVHLNWQTDRLGYLFAGIIDRGGEAGEAVFTILKDSAANRHEIGGPGGHTTRGLLCSSRPEAWEFAANLLLAAQRQEGLRQAILEAVDEAHPEAFQRMLGIVLDQNLIRFASVARAAGVWLGEEEAVENPKKLKADLQSIREMLATPAARTKAIAKGDALTAYRALWAIAFEDATAAIKAATPLFKDKDPARRFAAAKLAQETGLPEASALLLPLLNNPDLRLVSLGVAHASQIASADPDDDEPVVAPPPADLFERIEKLIPKLPEKQKELKPPVPGWFVPDLGQEDAAAILLNCLDKRPAERLLPYLNVLDQYDRVRALARLCEPRTLTTKVRQTLLAIAGEPNRYVREAALKYLKKSKLAEDEVQTLEGYLTRKTADFRRSIFELLLNRSDKLMLGSIDRLLASGDANCRAAGIELSRRMVDDDRAAEVIREKLRTYRDGKGKRLVAAEANAIEIVLNPAARPPTLADGLGTFDPAERSPVVEPKKRKVKFSTPAAVAFIVELDELIHTNRDKTFTDTRQRVSEEQVLGSIQYWWSFPTPDARKTADEDRKHMPLRELWEEWLSSRPAKTKDADGLELLRATMLPLESVREGELGDDWDDDDDDAPKKKDPAVEAALKQLRPAKPVKVRYQAVIDGMLKWFVKCYPIQEGVADFVLDAAETALALVPPSLIDKLPRTQQDEAEDDDDDDDDDEEKVEEWRDDSPFIGWLNKAREFRNSTGWTGEHNSRLYRLCQWLDEPGSGFRRHRPGISDLLPAYAVGSATLADFYDHLIGPRGKSRWSTESFDSLQQFSDGPNREFP